MAITIYDSFKQALPPFEQIATQVQTLDKPSGTNTAECTPPKCGIKIPVQHWINLASDRCLEQHKADLKTEFLPKVDNLIVLKSEADVADASTLYLTHPVHVAYELVHSSDRDCRIDQLTRPLRDTIPASRADRAYFSKRPLNAETPGNSTNIFAVLEYKKFQGLSRSEFNDGTVANFSDYATSLQHPPFIKQESNTAIFLQQATHYAGSFGTPFVALCDYSTLILLVMSKVEKSHGGEYTYLTVVENPEKMRKAYLGFLLAAKLHAQKNTDWRKNRADEDLFIKAETWEQELQVRADKPEKEAKRISRNPEPKNVFPSSQDTDASVGEDS